MGEPSKVKIVYDINLRFIHPPIPERHSDWQATREGYEPGSLVGYGQTPVVALADLLEQEMEAEEFDSTASHLSRAIKS